MAIDIFNIQPTTISRDLKGKFVCIYSLPKVGKTSMACQFPKNLLCAFEKGYNAIAGVKPIDITKWSDFKLVLRQLEKPEARELYDTVTLDTVGVAWEMCEQFVCAQNGVQKIADIPWGGGYSACKREFESCLRKITQLGYGLVIIAHVDKRIEKRADDTEVEILGPAIPKRAYEIVNQLVDIIGYIDVTWDENGNLVIAMEKKVEAKESCKNKEECKEKKSRYLRREFSYTKFQQTLILPEDVIKDTINASMCDGVLCIELPRKTPEPKNNITKVIEIK